MLFLYSRQMTTSTIQLTDALKSIFRETAQQLRGSERRQFMAKVVKGLGVGGLSSSRTRIGMEPRDGSLS